jgi:hypothetical protein
MKNTTCLGLALLACALLGVSTGRAAVVFDVSTGTLPLIGNASGPFSLEFQFNDGSGGGDGNNTVLLSDFNFNGGGLTGNASVVGGAAAGVGSVTLTDSAFFNSFSQPFTPGNSLHFRVSLGTNLDPGGTPDQFSFAILDKTGVEIPTTGLGNALVTVDINSPNPVPQSFGTASPTIQIAAPSVTPVPEPAAFSAMGILVLVVLTMKQTLLKRR